jgi:hypothetical protein
MEVSGKLHAPAVLPPEINKATEEEEGWAPKAVWNFLRGEDYIQF